jgi:hypothetical protein
VTTSRALRRERATDDDHLETALLNASVLVTHNERDFVLLHAAWRSWPGTLGAVLPDHPGILVLEDAHPQVLHPAVAGLLARQPTAALANELLRWSRSGGWERRVPRSGWLPT